MGTIVRKIGIGIGIGHLTVESESGESVGIGRIGSENRICLAEACFVLKNKKNELKIILDPTLDPT